MTCPSRWRATTRRRAGADATACPASASFSTLTVTRRSRSTSSNRFEDKAERANAKEKLAQVVEFCQLQACRRRFILGYFGEAGRRKLRRLRFLSHSQGGV